MNDNPIMRYSNLQLRASLANWSENERGKVDDTRGYGTDDRHTFKYRANLLDAAIARLVELEDAHAIASARASAAVRASQASSPHVAADSENPTVVWIVDK